MKNNLRKTTLLLTAISILVLLLFYNSNLFDFVFNDCKLKCYSVRSQNKEFNEKVKEIKNIPGEPFFDYSYNMLVGNSPGEMHQGVLYEVWYNGENGLGGGGSRNSNSGFIPDKYKHKLLVNQYLETDSTGKTHQMLAVQDFMKSYGGISSGRTQELYLHTDGVFKTMDKTVSSYEKDALIPVLAYFSPYRFKNKSEEIYDDEYEEIEIMEMDELIDRYVKKYDGFIVYIRNYKFKEFYDPLL